MFCSACGSESEEGARFCFKCGREMRQSGTPRPVLERTPDAVAPEAAAALPSRGGSALFITGAVAVLPAIALLWAIIDAL